MSQTSSTTPPVAPPSTTPSAPRSKTVRDPIIHTTEAAEAIKKANEQYNHRILQLMVKDWEKKSGHKFNVIADSEEEEASADTQTSNKITRTETAAVKPTKQSEQQAENTEQVVYGSAEWKAKNEGFVQMSKSEEEEADLFWSSWTTNDTLR